MPEKLSELQNFYIRMRELGEELANDPRFEGVDISVQFSELTEAGRVIRVDASEELAGNLNSEDS